MAERKYKIGDKVIGPNVFGKGRLPLIVIEVIDENFYKCQIEGTDISIAYMEKELAPRNDEQI